ncbi:ankyrin repeat domain-containing protein [Cronobacter sakazakii]|nr:ankyrin repeat domain-containing protein [Cronobacter sakazakii]MDK1057235.1 ankyrin repeat domain-containing protein [Cronobacter sakazakii]MDK1144026.1 ankyrin repeat domain-containing protein [Cronobacter sakazakii]MDK1333183.1 ankyrin repeat domain-containing protein [Cronobacter sakazakii]
MKTFRRLICSLLAGLALFSVVIPGHGSTNMKQAAPEVYFSGTQLQLAQAIAEHNLAEVKALAKSTNLNKPGSQEMTLLMYALLEATNGDATSLEIVTALVKAGADPLQDIPDFGSPAAVMASSNNPAYIKALIEGGLSPNAMTNYQPLIFNSASDNSFSVMKYLLSAGADVNKTDSAGKTVLMVALAGMELDQVEYLLNYGANPNIENQNGLNFGKLLADAIEREKDSNKRTTDKLEEVRQLAIRKGLHWPPAAD